MDAQAIAAVSLGRCPRVRSPECCRSSRRSRIVPRVPSSSSESRITNVCSSSGRDGFREIGRLGGRLLRTSGHECETEGLTGSLKKETLRRLMAGSVVCCSGRTGDGAMYRRDEGFSSNSDMLRTSPGKRAGGAHPSNDEYRDRYGRYGDGRSEKEAFAYREKRGSIPAFSPDDYGGRGVVGQMPGSRIYRSMDDGFRNSSRSYVSEDGEEGLKESRPARRVVEGVERGRGQENGGLQDSIPRQSKLNIPRSELMKIEELMFSGDLQQGDSGRQVLNLQRALFWLGHLRGLSLNGYFGSETTKALREFHLSHGFSGPGVWGNYSKQMLWKHLHPEYSHRELAGGSSENDSIDQKQAPGHVVADPWHVVKNVSGMTTGLIASVSSLPLPRVATGNIGVILLSFVLLSGITKYLQFCLGLGQVQPARRRIINWQSNGNLKRLLRKPTFSSAQPGSIKLGAVDIDHYNSQSHVNQVCPQLDSKKQPAEELHSASKSLPQTGVTPWGFRADEQVHYLGFDQRPPVKKVPGGPLKEELQELKDINDALLLSLQKKRIISQVVGRAIPGRHQNGILKHDRERLS